MLTIDETARAAEIADQKAKEEEQDIRYFRWKKNVPVLYDAFVNHNIEWSSLSAQWGGVVNVPDPRLVAPAGDESEVEDDLAAWRRRHTMPHTLYFSSRSAGGPGGAQAANQLLVAQVPLLYRPQRSRSWNLSRFNEERSSSDILVTKRIMHPGEVNRIRVSSREPHLVATHCDSPLVFVWDANAQVEKPSAALSAARGIADPGVPPNTPELTLTGHTDKAEYALDFSKLSRKIVSGGSDCKVLMWAFPDAAETALGGGAGRAAAGASSAKRQRVHAPEASGGSAAAAAPAGPQLAPRTTFVGHEKTVEDVRFHPASDNICCSVGDDQLLAFWDARVSSSPIATVRDLHTDDINCVAWNPVETAYILTGGSDRLINIVDWRRLSTDARRGGASVGASQRSAAAGAGGTRSDAALRTFASHDSAVMTVQWSPYDPRFFASSADDASLYIWNSALAGAAQTSAEAAHGPPELVFRHCGHRGNIVDYEWKPQIGPRATPEDEWTFVSVSDDSARASLGGGTLQIWRPSALAQHAMGSHREDGAALRAANALGSRAGDPALPVHRASLRDWIVQTGERLEQRLATQRGSAAVVAQGTS